MKEKEQDPLRGKKLRKRKENVRERFEGQTKNVSILTERIKIRWILLNSGGYSVQFQTAPISTHWTKIHTKAFACSLLCSTNVLQSKKRLSPLGYTLSMEMTLCSQNLLTIYQTMRCHNPEWTFKTTTASNIKRLLSLIIKSSTDYMKLRKPWLCLRMWRACILLQRLWNIISLSHPLKPKAHDSRSATSNINDSLASSHPSEPGVLEQALRFLKNLWTPGLRNRIMVCTA